MFAPIEKFFGQPPAIQTSSDGGIKPSFGLMVFMFWIVAAGFLSYVALFLVSPTRLVVAPDDAMRLVQVRDLLAGQGWFDLSQVRLFPEDGVLMHWSRLIDAPIAVLITLFTLLLGPANGEATALFVWPLLLLGGLLWVSAALSVRLSGEKGLLPGLLLPLLFIPLIYEYQPGRLDHHGAEIVLTLLLLYGVIDMQTSRFWAIIAGVAATVMVAIALETLPFAAAGLLAVGLGWIWRGENSVSSVKWFGLGLAASSSLLYLGTVPASPFAQSACDAYSLVHTVILGASGVGFVGLSFAGRYLPQRFGRFCAAGVVGLFLGFLVVLLFPHCLAGPYGGLDQRLEAMWLSQIQEARNVFDLWAADPYQLITYFTLPILGVAAALFAFFRSDRHQRIAWLVFLLFLSVALLVALMQVRGAKFAGALAVPAGAFVIAQALSWKTGTFWVARYGKALAVCLSFLCFAGLAHGVVATTLKNIAQPPSDTVGSRSAIGACLAADALRPLNRLPAGVVMGSSDLGAHILAYTHHPVLAAPYHRNEKGLLAMIDFFTNPADQSLLLAKAHNVSYLVHCPGTKPLGNNVKVGQNSLGQRLVSGKLPSWIQPVSLSQTTPLRVYKISLPQ